MWADQQRAGWVGQGSADQPDQTEHNDEEQNTSLGSMALEELRKKKKKECEEDRKLMYHRSEIHDICIFMLQRMLGNTGQAKVMMLN